MLRKHLQHFLNFFQTQGTYFRKVVSIPDVEGKTREVAVLDYFTQTSLRPLHKYLFRVLRKIPQDCTFNQGAFSSKIELSVSDKKFYSVDLTAATDRFPIKLITEILSYPLGSQFANHWQSVMVGYP
jgi:hypothetical protein